MTKASYEAFRIMQEKSADNKNPYWKKLQLNHLMANDPSEGAFFIAAFFPH